MKKFVKYLLFGVLTLAIGSFVTGCYGEDIKELKDRATALEEKLAALDDVRGRLDQLELDVAEALAAAEGVNDEVASAIEAAKLEAIAAAKAETDKLRQELPGMIDSQIDDALVEFKATYLDPLKVEIENVREDANAAMIAVLQLQLKVLEIYGQADQDIIDLIEGYIADLKEGKPAAEVVDLDELAAMLGRLSVLNLGQITGIELFPSITAHTANILYNGLQGLANEFGDSPIDWETNVEELLQYFFSYYPTIQDLAGPLLLDFNATKSITNYNFGAGVNDGLPKSFGDPQSFKVDEIIYSTPTSFIVKVNPSNAKLTKEELMFVRYDGNVDVNQYFEFINVESYKDLSTGTRASVDNGLWKITVQLKKGLRPTGIDSLEELVTADDTLIPYPGHLGEEVDDYIRQHIPIEFLYRKYMFAIAATKPNNDGTFDPEKNLAGNLVASKYEIGLYPINLKPVYNRYNVEVEGEAPVRHDEFRFSVEPEPGLPAVKHTAIHNRFERVEAYNPGVSLDVPTEYRWVDGRLSSTLSTNYGSVTWAEKDGETMADLATQGHPINVDTDYNPYDATFGPLHGDNRQIQKLLPVRKNKEFTISIDNPGLVSHYYVALDEDWALESVPSEFNAWRTYTYDWKVGASKTGTFDRNSGMYSTAVAASTEKTTIKINSSDINDPTNDIIGFRVFIVNYDGTLVDPDGKAFYVVVLTDTMTGTISTEIVWPEAPYYTGTAAGLYTKNYITRTGEGNDGSVATDYVYTKAVKFEVTGEPNFNMAALDGLEWRLVDLKYKDDATYWVADNMVPKASLVRYSAEDITKASSVANTWAATKFVGFRNINPRGIENGKTITGRLEFFSTTQPGLPNDQEIVRYVWNVTILKNMPGFPENLDYRTKIFENHGATWVEGGSKYGQPDADKYPNHGQVLWAYPSKKMSSQRTLSTAILIDTPNTDFFGNGSLEPAGNYNFFSSIYFGELAPVNYFGVLDPAGNDYPNPDDNYIAGFRFFNREISPLSSKAVYPYYGEDEGNGFINHDIRVYEEEIGLNDPVDRAVDGKPLANKPADDIFTNREVDPETFGYVLSSNQRNGRQMETHQAEVRYGWGYIDYEVNNTTAAEQLYWTDAEKDSKDMVTLVEKQYPINIRFRSFIQDLYVINDYELPTLIYNALKAEWKYTDEGELDVQSLTGNVFPISYAVNAKYDADITRAYKVVNVAIWTGPDADGDGLGDRKNEYFEPLVPSDTEFAVEQPGTGASEDAIIWRPKYQQDTPGQVEGDVTMDIEDEFGHVYRMKLPNKIIMDRSEVENAPVK